MTEPETTTPEPVDTEPTDTGAESALPTPEAIAYDAGPRAHARRIVIGAAALASLGLAPLVDELILGTGAFEPRMNATTLLYGAWSAILGALVGGQVVRSSLERRPWRVLALAALGGTLHPAMLFAPVQLDELSRGELLDVVRMTGGILVLSTLVAGPIGLVFGLVFSAGVWPLQPHYAARSPHVVRHAWTASARILLAASVPAGLLAYVLAGSYCQLIFFLLLPALGLEAPPGTDIEWTRLVLVPAPFFLAAAVSWACAGRLAPPLTAPAGEAAPSADV